MWRQGIPEVFLPSNTPAPPGGSWDVPRSDEMDNPSSRFWVCLVAPLSWLCPEDLKLRRSGGSWSKSSTLEGSFVMKEHRLNSELYTLRRKLISATCIGNLEFMTTGEGWNVDQLVNQVLCLPVKCPLHHDGLAQRLQYCWCCNKPPFHLTLHLHVTREQNLEIPKLLLLGNIPWMVSHPVWLRYTQVKLD